MSTIYCLIVLNCCISWALCSHVHLPFLARRRQNERLHLAGSHCKEEELQAHCGTNHSGEQQEKRAI